jgi:splicing factor 3B subunit 3
LLWLIISMVVAGLLNGVLLRTEVDKVTGQLSDTRTRFLGTRPPKLFAVSVRGKRSMLALSSRPWLVRCRALVAAA